MNYDSLLSYVKNAFETQELGVDTLRKGPSTSFLSEGGLFFHDSGKMKEMFAVAMLCI